MITTSVRTASRQVLMDVFVVGKTHPSHLSFDASFGSPDVKKIQIFPLAPELCPWNFPPIIEASLNRLEARVGWQTRCNSRNQKQKTTNILPGRQA
jgi:hypothetical protein